MASSKNSGNRGRRVGRRTSPRKSEDLPLTRNAFEKVTGSSTPHREMVWRRSQGGPLKSILAAHPELCVLTVHDDPAVRALIRRTLSALGVPRQEDAEDGLTGLERLGNRPADLIVVSYEMAAMSGVEFLQRLRRHASPNLRSIPVIVTIAEPTAQQVLEISAAGAHEILASPFSASALAQHIGAIFTENRRHIETPTYAGPERRNGSGKFTGAERRHPARED